jgi:hypothetical protein
MYMGTIWKEMWLKLLYCFVFFRNKVIQWTFCSYHVPRKSVVLKSTKMKF